MKKSFCTIFILCFSFWFIPGLSAEETHPNPSEAQTKQIARANVLQLAGAFSNDGYKIRDGYWISKINPGEKKLIVVNLFYGNQYWFCVAGTSSEQRFSVTIYNAKKKFLKANPYQNGATSAVGFQVPVTGKYFIQIELNEGNKTEFCFVYCYK